MKTNFRSAFGTSLSQIRKAKNRTQEDFSRISSRTYISALENGVQSPTLDKVNALATELGVHPLTLISLAYMNADGAADISVLHAHVEAELRSMGFAVKQRGRSKDR